MIWIINRVGSGPSMQYQPNLGLVRIFHQTTTKGTLALPESIVKQVSQSDNTTSKNVTTLLKVVIVIQLSGELGNHLSKIASGVGLAIWLQTKTPYDVVHVDILLRHQTFHRDTDQNRKKWMDVEYELHKCFPNTMSWNFSQANTDDITNKIEILKYNLAYTTLMDSFRNLESDTRIIQHLHNYLNGPEGTIVLYDNISDSILLYVDHMVGLDNYIDRYINQYRQLFHLDPKCCRMLPIENEVIFHFRNFAKDLPRKSTMKGYEELPPNQIHVAMKHFPPNTKIAILSRPYDSNEHGFEHVEPYKNNLERIGHKVRIVTNQTSIQDFCFLKSSRVEMIGLARSTFFLWAAFLAENNNTKVQAYSIDSPAKRDWVKQVNGTIHEYYNWSNPTLRNQFHFPLYSLD